MTVLRERERRRSMCVWSLRQELRSTFHIGLDQSLKERENVCVCVCVCVKERERKREGVFVCVCVCLSFCE